MKAETIKMVEGVWVVFFLDNYGVIISIWDNELAARRAADADQFYYVKFVKFGAEEIHRELTK